jgi:hypothetical protein
MPYPCKDLKQENPQWTRKDRAKKMEDSGRKEKECLDCELYSSCFPANTSRKVNRMNGKAHKLGFAGVGKH